MRLIHNRAPNSTSMETTRRDIQLKNENIELAALLEAINLKYGYDFRRYARTSIKRRVMDRLARSGLPDIFFPPTPCHS